MAMSKKNMETILAAMRQCDADQLRDINMEALRLYKAATRIEGAQKARQMSVGTRVRFKQGLRPGYLCGETGTIEEFRNTRLLVKLDRGPVGKFKNGKVVSTPLSLDILEP